LAISVVAVVVAVGVVFLALWLGARRRKALSLWAASHGLLFDPARARGYDDRYPAFRCLRRGHSRSASNLMRGVWKGHDAVAFDYRYVTGHGKSRSVHSFSAAIVSTGVSFEPLRVRPEGLFDRVTEFLGFDDIDFESVEFSRAFHVSASSARFAYDVLHQRTMEFLLAAPRFHIQFDNGEAIIWRDRRFDGETFGVAMDVIAGILDRLPPYVRQGRERT